ncbi:hypothetical protein [Liquorilactobacillus sicerae]|uniref:hypothetical protein n=1 Tax=Liquorilactobacillus sicerae TaxID=1416943 RepID=UPI002481091C|nr:hypothetical protein [Liquorilactobacillus sicerae]
MTPIISLSEWQGKINFQLIKTSGINFVSFRTDYGKLLTQKDKCFENNHQQA